MLRSWIRAIQATCLVLEPASGLVLDQKLIHQIPACIVNLGYNEPSVFLLDSLDSGTGKA